MTIGGLFTAIKKEQRFFTAIAVAFAVLVALLPLFNKAFYGASKRFAGADAQRVSAAFTQESEALLAHAHALAEGGTLQAYIEQGDILNLTALLEGEQEKRKVDNILVTDAQGVVLTRTKSLAKRGDFIFQTTNWGRVLGQGETVATIDESIAWPLTAIGGYPLKTSAGTPGAVVVQNVLDSAYAERLSSRYLKDGARLAFYTSEHGIVGDSFNDEEVSALLAVYFSHGSDLAQGAHMDEEVRIKGAGYLIKNIVFEGAQESPGGALVFFPRHFLYQSAIFSVILTLIFFLFILLAISRSPVHEHFRILAISCVVFFFVSLAINIRVLTRLSIPLDKPAYTIYNSTMEFDPAVGILDLRSEHRVAIKIVTGGEAINAAQAVVEFDPTAASVADIITTNSFCPQEFFLEKTIDNNKGEVTIACAIPNPGFVKQVGILAELLLDPTSEGALNLHFGDESQVLAHDGLGTNVLRVATSGNYRIYGGPSFEDIGGRPSIVPAPLVFSPSHPNSERWYNKGKITFSWRALPGHEYFYAFNQTPDFNPGGAQVSRKGTLVFDVKQDGVYFFHLVAAQGKERSAPAHFRVRIDRSAPEAPTVQASATRVKAGETVRFTFAGSDKTSGLQRNFYVKRDRGLFLPVSSSWSAAFAKKGRYTVVLRTFDQAENFTDTKVEVLVE